MSATFFGNYHIAAKSDISQNKKSNHRFNPNLKS